MFTTCFSRRPRLAAVARNLTAGRPWWEGFADFTANPGRRKHVLSWERKGVIRMVSEAGFRDVAVWVMLHHERVDGTGYPHGLAGDEIPIEARILAVADAYEAMTADRVYRRSIGHEAACRELRRCAGTQFDADVVVAFLAGSVEELPTLRPSTGRG